MSLEAVIPFKPLNPKTRLSSVLSKMERELFANAMLSDVITALKSAGCRPSILSTTPLNCDLADVTVCDKELNPALNELLQETRGPLLIMMADLPLVTPEVVGRIVSTPGDVVIGPGRGGGTNAIFIRERSRFHVDYYGASFLKHQKIAEVAGLTCTVVDSFRLHTDIDEEEDLVELLIHGHGKAAEYLKHIGFRLSIEQGRVGVTRNECPGHDQLFEMT